MRPRASPHGVWLRPLGCLPAPPFPLLSWNPAPIVLAESVSVMFLDIVVTSFVFVVFFPFVCRVKSQTLFCTAPPYEHHAKVFCATQSPCKVIAGAAARSLYN